MKILYAASEAVPFCKTGGLADVAGSLPAALAAQGADVAVVLPLCVLSVTIYLLRGGLDWMEAAPYMVGGAVGGFVGGRWFKGMKMGWLKRVFGLLLLYGGVRCFL